jgi:hypothetical protein
MTIRYTDGRTMEAVLLSRTANILRAAVRGSEDAIELQQVKGVWVTDDCEPVHVTFEWQRVSRPQDVTLEDCLCSPDLAARLVDLLHTPSDEDTPEVNPVNDLPRALPAHSVV